MPPPLKIVLTEEQRDELEDVRDHHSKPYMRERAAAILKIADGASGFETARRLLNRPHWQDTIYEWCQRYRELGIQARFFPQSTRSLSLHRSGCCMTSGAAPKHLGSPVPVGH